MNLGFWQDLQGKPGIGQGGVGRNVASENCRMYGVLHFMTHIYLLFILVPNFTNDWNMNYKNIVFEGGGVKGIAYAGALHALDEFGLLTGIERVAGTSAGAITAALVSVNYSPEEIHQIIGSTNFKTFEDRWDPLRIVTKYGLFKGDAFLSWIKERISAKGLDPNATFADFKARNCKDLHVFATDLNLQNVKEFSFETTPDVPVCEAVRASMSIPLFFMAWRFTNSNPDDHVYVDGGTVYNYPIDAFDSGTVPNYETLGFHLDDLDGVAKPSNLGYDEIRKYTEALFRTLMLSQVIDFEKDAEQLARTVRINDFGIPATDFDISSAQIEQLYQSGLDATRAYLIAKGFSPQGPGKS